MGICVEEDVFSCSAYSYCIHLYSTLYTTIPNCHCVSFYPGSFFCSPPSLSLALSSNDIVCQLTCLLVSACVLLAVVFFYVKKNERLVLQWRRCPGVCWFVTGGACSYR